MQERENSAQMFYEENFLVNTIKLSLSMLCDQCYNQFYVTFLVVLICFITCKEQAKI